MPDPTSKTRDQQDASRPHSSWVNWLAGTPGVALAFLWGLAEGTFFFVVPDVAISMVALLRPGRAWRHILAAILGGVAGGAILFGWASREPQNARDAIARVPFITAKMFAHVHASYQLHGLGAVFLGPLFGTPYKIYAVEAPQFVGKAAFLWGTGPARAERYLLVWATFAGAGALLRRIRRRTDSQLALGHVSFWTVFYAFYWSLIAFR